MTIASCIVELAIGQWPHAPIGFTQALVQFYTNEDLDYFGQWQDIYLFLSLIYLSFPNGLDVGQSLDVLEDAGRIEQIYHDDFQVRNQISQIEIAAMQNFDYFWILEYAFETGLIILSSD